MSENKNIDNTLKEKSFFYTCSIAKNVENVFIFVFFSTNKKHKLNITITVVFYIYYSIYTGHLIFNNRH